MCGNSICVFTFGTEELHEHCECEETERGIIRTHASVGRPIPDADEPIAHQHKVGEEEKEACARDRCGQCRALTHEVADRLTEHGGDDEGVDEAHDTENGNLKGQQGGEEEEHAGGEHAAADHAVDFSDLLQKAVGDDEADVSEREDRRAGDELPVDQHVTEEREEESRGHGEIEFFVGLLCREGVKKVDHAEQGEQRAAGTFQHAHEIARLIEIVQNEDEGDHQQIERQHKFFRLFHRLPLSV